MKMAAARLLWFLKRRRGFAKRLYTATCALGGREIQMATNVGGESSRLLHSFRNESQTRTNMADFKPSFKSTENIGQVDKDGENSQKKVVTDTEGRYAASNGDGQVSYNKEEAREDVADFKPSLRSSGQVDSNVDGEPKYDEEDLKKMYKDAKIQTTELNYDELNKKQKEMVAKSQAMIVVVNYYEDLATKCYLKPPDGSNVILEVHHKAKYGSDIDTRIFLIGKIGKCPVAVTKVSQGRGRDAAFHANTDVFHDMKVIIAVGVAAGFPENKVKLGDVLISDRIHDCSMIKVQDGEIIPRGNVIPASKYMLERLHRKLDWQYPCTKDLSRNSTVVIGPILSKSELLNDAKIRKQYIHAHCKEAKGYEMEGFGIMETEMKCIIVKGVCDYAGQKAKIWQPTAALAANDYLFQDLNRKDLSLLLNEQGITTDGAASGQPRHVAIQPFVGTAAHTSIGVTGAGPVVQNALLPPSTFEKPANQQDTESQGGPSSSSQTSLDPAVELLNESQKNSERDEPDGKGSANNGHQLNQDGVQLDANKHNFMVKELARRLSDDEINHRMLYRDFCLTQDQKQKIDDYPQMHYKMYETLAQYIESKQPMLAELIKILNANQVKQEHVKFLYDCKYD
ncbi:uncharacterized protein [Dysidea avara]|uniref:uncharacterized protein isoform X2 n=1 Tax=Dysidea avara TaxID=196820 RepID=UPI0033320C7B